MNEEKNQFYLFFLKMLYLIPTPVGNKEDITIRALRLMRELKFLICEDTRTTRKLLQMYEIDYSDKQFFSLTSFTDKGKLSHYVNLIAENEVGMLSDAGTPGLSDPGKVLIQLCYENGLKFSVLPGANALVPAVVGAGFDTSSFVYIWFLPQKKGRQTALKTAIQSQIPTFFYESVHRMEKLIKDLEELGFDGKVMILRELSKAFEEVQTLEMNELLQKWKSGDLVIKGEFVVGICRK